MAGDWIKMRTALGSEREVIAISTELGIDEFSVVGRLHALWSWFDQHTKNGHAVGITFDWIDKFLRAEKFSDALSRHGWLTASSDGVRVPRFERHNGKSGKRRGLASKRQVTHRSRSRNTKSVTKALPEKRREEKNNNNPIVPSSFDTFWELYPARDGSKVGKAATREKFSKLSPEDQANVLIAVKNYAASERAKSGFAKDPVRFLSADWWRDWIEAPAVVPSSTSSEPRIYSVEETKRLMGIA